MKLKQSFLYQLADYRAGIVVYYCAVVALFAVMDLLLAANSLEGTDGSSSTYVTLSGFSALTALFLFICGLCSLHENLPMHLQNGVSRRTMFLARLLVTAAVCALCALIDHLLGFLLNAILQGIAGGQRNFADSAANPVGETLLSLGYSFTALLLASCAGYFLIAMFYRLPNYGRVILGVCLGVGFFGGQIAVKAADALLFHNFLARFAEDVVYPLQHTIESSPLLTMGLWVVEAAALSGLTWLFLRRSVVRR